MGGILYSIANTGHVKFYTLLPVQIFSPITALKPPPIVKPALHKTEALFIGDKPRYDEECTLKNVACSCSQCRAVFYLIRLPKHLLVKYYWLKYAKYHFFVGKVV